MAKNILTKSIKEKMTRNRRVVTVIRHDSFTNSLLSRSFAADLQNDDRFVFVITIVIHPSITITGINVNGVIAKADDIKTGVSTITCELKAFVSTSTFFLIIDAEGVAGATTTFNMTCDTLKVFSIAPNIIISSSKRGGFAEPKVPLP